MEDAVVRGDASSWCSPMPSIAKRCNGEPQDSGESDQPPSHRRKVMETNGDRPAAGSKVCGHFFRLFYRSFFTACRLYRIVLIQVVLLLCLVCERGRCRHHHRMSLPGRCKERRLVQRLQSILTSVCVCVITGCAHKENRQPDLFCV